MAGIAGRKCQVKVSGDPTTLTAAATTTSDDQVYQITDASKRVLDPEAAITVKDNGVATAEAYTVQRLTGTIRFADVDALRGPITVDGTYLPLSVAAEATSYTHTLVGTNADNSAFGDDYVKRQQIGRDVNGSLSGWWVDSYYADALVAGDPVVLEFLTDSSTRDLICWAVLNKRDMNAALRALTTESVSFDGTVDVDGHASSLDALAA